MPSRPPSRSDRSRAEARRRARLAAQGEPAEDADLDDSSPASPPASGGFLSRVFPPAPPLRGHERPLEGFDYVGSQRFRGISETIWILARNPLAWIGAGAVWAVSRLLTDTSAVGIAMSVVSFGSLIAAGWFGWQRPTLYGTAASLVSYLLVTALILVQLGQMGADVESLGPERVIPDLVLRALYQAGLGFLGGWYGGYLRRRQTQMATTDTRRRR